MSNFHDDMIWGIAKSENMSYSEKLELLDAILEDRTNEENGTGPYEGKRGYRARQGSKGAKEES